LSSNEQATGAAISDAVHAVVQSGEPGASLPILPPAPSLRCDGQERLRRYPDGQNTLPCGRRHPGRCGLPGYFVRPAQRRAPCPILQTPDEPRLWWWFRNIRSLRGGRPAFPGMASPGTGSVRRSLPEWIWKCDREKNQALSCSNTFAFFSRLRTVSVGCAPSFRRLTMAGISSFTSSVRGL